MKTKESQAGGRLPAGNLCVIRDDSLNHWSVMMCPGVSGDRKPLKQFSTRSEAEAFAQNELTRLKAQGGDKRYVLHVDDCPCGQRQL